MAKDLAEWLDEFVAKGADPNNVLEWAEEVGEIEVVDELPEVGKPDVLYKLPDGTIWSCVNTTETQTVCDLKVGESFKLVESISYNDLESTKAHLKSPAPITEGEIYPNFYREIDAMTGIEVVEYQLSEEEKAVYTLPAEATTEPITIQLEGIEEIPDVEITQYFVDNLIEEGTLEDLIPLFENSFHEEEVTVSTWTEITAVQADWNQTDNTKPDFIKNKPAIPAAQVQTDWNQNDSESVDFIKNKPTIPAAQVQANWNETNTNSKAYIQNKPSLSVTTETLTFTYEDNSTETITMVTGVTLS